MTADEKRQYLISWIQDLDDCAIDDLFNEYLDREDDDEDHDYEAFTNID